MTCHRFREGLPPDLALPAEEAFRTHFDGCAACRAFLHVQREIRERVRRLEHVPPPPALVWKVRALVAREAATPVSAWRRRVWIGPILAVAAVIAIAVGLRTNDPTDMAKPFAAQASAALDPATGYRSNDASNVERWLAARTGERVTIPDIADAQLVGGRVLEVAGQMTAAADFRLHGQSLTWFAVPSPEIGGRRVSDAGIMSASIREYHVAMWSEAGGVRVIAAPMPFDDVMAIAADCRMQALRGRAL
ncbi:MAG TPA: hypothetical protein VGA37_16770 [Gemmatimonadales bacterium]